MGARALGVEGENTLMVAPHQENGWQLFGQCVQPAHVEGTGHGALPGQRHAPAGQGRERRGGYGENGGDIQYCDVLHHCHEIVDVNM